jgi:bifunctional enzyme CysN/CysC
MNTIDQTANVYKNSFCITRASREGLNGHAGMVVWLTGLSGSGKSTIANALEKKLYAQGRHTYILDGDNIRSGLCSDLGFSDADRIENIRRITEVSKLMLDAGLVVITAFISPFRSERKIARELIGGENFFEVYVKTPLAVCEQRDPKKLYKMARNGSLQNMTGIDSPYECPEAPSAIIDSSNCTPDEIADTLISAIKLR